MASSRRKRLLRVLLVLVLGCVILAALLPLWLPWALRPAAKSLKLNYGSYEREGYGRFRLTDVTLSLRSGSFRAARVEGFVPTVWLMKLGTGDGARPAFAEINDWQFVHQRATNRPARAASTYTNFHRLEASVEQLARWIPRAELTQGEIRAKNTTLQVPRATWQNRRLTAELVWPENRAFHLEVADAARRPLEISLRSEALELQLNASIQETNASLRMDAAALWSGNHIAATAEFAPHGRLPRTADVRADSFEFPAQWLDLKDYKNLTGSFQIIWTTNRLALDLTAHAAPESPDLPPLNLEARAYGDTNSIQIETARLSAPGLEARLSEGARVRFTPPFVTEPVLLAVTADLSRQPWFAGAGTLEGRVTLQPAELRFPRASFALFGNGVTVSNVETATLQLEGDFHWPRLTLAPFRITTPDGSAVVVTGAMNLAEKTVLPSELNYSGTFGRELLPEGYFFERAEVRTRVAGPWANPEHAGTVTVSDLQVPGAEPMRLNAEWNGHGLALSQTEARLVSGGASLVLRGSADAAGAVKQATISALHLQTSAGEELTLDRPFSIQFTRASTEQGPNWRVEFGPLHWTGNGRELQAGGRLNWPERGSFRITARNLESALLRDFVSATNLLVTLNDFDLAGGWTNGPVSFGLNADAKIETGSPPAFSVNAAIHGSSEGIVVQQATVASATQLVARAEGTVPIFFRPAATGDWLQVNAGAPLRFQAGTETNSLLWDELSERLGVRLRQPELRVDVSGTWARPQGEARLNVAAIQFVKTERPLPALENLQFRMKVNETESQADFSAMIEGQRVSAAAEAPLGRGIWTALLRERRLPDWRVATGRLTVEHAQLAAFAGLVPEIMAPQGEFNLDVRLERGELRGEAALENGRTRPLATLGPLRNINARAWFAGRTVLLTNAVAEVGGQRVSLHGEAQLNDDFFSSTNLPPFQVYLRGTNVPLVRRPGVVVRADLNLSVTNSAGTNTIVAGQVRLRDSYFMSSLQDLVPGKVAAPERRPPYFSVANEPLASWRLAARVDGDQFLKVRSPVFRGTVSTGLRLEGTLKTPMALGEARVNSGRVTFPFGSLEVQQGFVSLTSDNPYQPQLFLTATGTRMGYEIRMEATGPVDEPVIQFSSTPPLSSEQIVLMLTTGQLPQGTADTRQRAQGLALFVGRNLLSEFGLGGDGEERLTIRSGEHVTEAGRPTYEIEYKWTDDWSLVGEYDRFGQYNIGLKWRVYSK